MTNQEQFRTYLKQKGFRMSPNLATLSLVAHYYKDTDKNHVLIQNVSCSMFVGVNTKDGDLGCVCFFYGGTKRLKRHRESFSAEILKEVSVYGSADEAIKAFELWRRNSGTILATWTMVI